MNDGIRHLLEYATEQSAIGREATSAELHSIAEVIDCEMRSLKDELDHWMELAHQWEAGASTRGFAERLEAAASERADVTLFGVDYMACPLDADGVPIHVGDVVTMDLMFGGKSKPLVVDRMELSRGKDGNLWCVALDTDESCWNQPSLLRHHHAPTVEDVLREFLDNFHDASCIEVEADVVAEYAAKLRLAGEDE